MKIDQRKYKLLDYFLTHDEFVTSEILSGILEVSSRTVREDLKVLTKELLDNEVHLLSIQGQGYRIDSPDFAKLRRYMRNLMKDPVTILSVVENKFQILRILFLTNQLISIDRIADKVYLSKSSIEKEIAAIEKWLDDFGLSLNKKKTIGISISGNEIDFRIALIQLIKGFSLEGNFCESQLFHPILNKGICDQLNAIFDTIKNEPFFNLSQNAFTNLKLYLAITLWRIRNNHFVEKKIEVEEAINSLTEKILFNFQELTGILLPYDEVFELNHFIGQLEPFSIEQIMVNKDYSEIITTQLAKIDDRFNQSFLNDAILIEHFNFLIHWARYNKEIGKIENKVDLNEIKANYPRALDMALYSKIELEEELQIQFDDVALGYLALFFSSALEKRALEGIPNKKRVAIVCEMGIGVTHLLQVKIERLFPELYIEGIYPNYLVNKLERKNLDFIICTGHLDGCSLPIVEISHILTNDDFLKIKKILQQIDKEEFESYFFQSLFDESIFVSDLAVETPEEAIAQLAKYLEKANHVSENFKVAVLNREATMTTNIGNMVAIPHALSSGKKSSIAVGILKKPIVWHDENVRIVFLINIRYQDTERMKSIFTYFYNLVDSKKKINQLIQTTTFEQFIQLLKKGDY